MFRARAFHGKRSVHVAEYLEKENPTTPRRSLAFQGRIFQETLKVQIALHGTPIRGILRDVEGICEAVDRS